MTDAAESESSNRALVRRMQEAIGAGDYEKLRALVHPDVVQEMPQSGERVVGVDNLIATLANRPGRPAPDSAPAQLIGEEPRYVMTPTFNLVRVEGTGDTFTVCNRTRYPDGSDWYVISVVTLRDGKIAKQVAFFAPCYAAPEWRAQWVESMD
jgi:ketosteroid isomerase-like protein